MARTAVRLTFEGDTFKDPVIYTIGKEFGVVTNIRRANVAEGSGWVELELDGEQADLDRALEYCRTRGVGVELLRTA